MNRACRILCLLVPFSISGFEKICKTGHSFMFSRPVEHDVYAQNKHWFRINGHDDYEPTWGAQVIGMYQTTWNKAHTASYFLVNCKCDNLIAGDESVDASVRDIRAEWLGLPSNFSGILSLRPEQQQSGALIMIERSLAGFLPWDFFDTWWIRASLPIVHVRQDINIFQSNITNPGTTTPRNILEAFNQETWSAGKMISCDFDKSGVTNFNLTLGTTWWNTDNYVLAAYTGLSAPISHTVKPTYIFKPFSGTNGHWQLDAGLITEIPVGTWCNDNLGTTFFLMIENHYILAKKQRRILELHDKPWARYMLFRKEGDPETIQGVNILTQCVNVRPFNAVELATGLSFNWGGFDFAVGYGIWARNREKICLERLKCETSHYSFEDYGIAGTAAGTSASTSTISTLGPDDPSFVRLNLDDIDFCATGSRGGSAHRVFGSAGYLLERCAYEIAIDIGGYVDFPRTNVMLKTWGVWGKIAASY